MDKPHQNKTPLDKTPPEKLNHQSWQGGQNPTGKTQSPKLAGWTKPHRKNSITKVGRVDKTLPEKLNHQSWQGGQNPTGKTQSPKLAGWTKPYHSYTFLKISFKILFNHFPNDKF